MPCHACRGQRTTLSQSRVPLCEIGRRSSVDLAWLQVPLSAGTSHQPQDLVKKNKASVWLLSHLVGEHYS